MTFEEDSEHAIASQLVARIRAGGADAVAAKSELVARYSRGLETLMRWKTGDPELAKDIRQETLLRALEKLEVQSPNEPHKLASWLNGIAVNLWRNDIKKQTSRKTDLAGNFDDIVIVSDEPLPAVALLNEEVRTIVQMLMDELPVEIDREILRRVFWLDQDPGEICAALGIERAQLSRKVYKAKARFKKLLLIAQRRKGFHIVPADERDES